MTIEVDLFVHSCVQTFQQTLISLLCPRHYAKCKECAVVKGRDCGLCIVDAN